MRLTHAASLIAKYSFKYFTYSVGSSGKFYIYSNLKKEQADKNYLPHSFPY